MVWNQWNAEFVRDDLMNLIPCENFIAGNLKSFADRLRIAHKSGESPREVCIKRNRP